MWGHGNQLAALNVDGAQPAVFPTADSVSVVWTVEVVPDGRVAVGGAFATVGGEPQQGFAVLENASDSP